MGIIVAIIIFVVIWNTGIGKFLLGNIAKLMYSLIAVAICMAIPIPVLNVIFAIIVVIKIWDSPIG